MFFTSAVTIFAAIIRILFLDKTTGMWNDEYVGWYIAQMPFAEGFWHAVWSQCHMPIYYLYLKIFNLFAPNSDIVLRISSVVVGVLNVPIMYFVGKEKDVRTAKICAGFVAISSFLIYFSQEIRPYGLIFLFSALSLLYTMRLTKTPSKRNLLSYVGANLLIIFTHTIGFVYVFFNLAYVGIKLWKTNRSLVIKSFITLFVGVIMPSPLSIKIFAQQTFSQWWNAFSISKIGFLFTDYFSPILTNLNASPENFFYNFSTKFLIFAILPSLLALIAIGKSLTKKENRELFYIALATVSVLVIASICEKLVFLTKYSIEIYPILILLMSIGFLSINNKAAKIFCISMFFALNLTYLAVSGHSALKLVRGEGHKIPAGLIERAQLKSGDTILLTYYDQSRFNRYFDFSPYKVISINKGNFPSYLSNKLTYSDALNNGNALFYEIFSSENKFLADKLEKEIYAKMTGGNHLAVLTLRTVAKFDPFEFRTLLRNKKTYDQTPFMYLAFSSIRNEVLSNAAKRLQITRIEYEDAWSLTVFTKLNN